MTTMSPGQLTAIKAAVLQEGLLANWKRGLPQDADFQGLSDTVPGATSANATR